MIDYNETICTIRWTVEDMIEVLKDNGFDCSEETIRRLMDNTNLKKVLYERSREEGWYILDDLVCMNIGAWERETD